MGIDILINMKVPVITIFICFFVSADFQPLTNDPIDDFLKEVLELIRLIMITGSPELGVPVLDPFEVPEFEDIHLDEDIIKADIAIKDLVIKNLSTFETEISHLELNDLSLELELKIADLRGDAWYNLTGLVLELIPLYGHGAMWLEIYEMDLYAKAAVVINEDGFLQANQMKISANFTSIKTYLDGLMDGGNFGDSINNLLNLLGDFIWDLVKEPLFELLEGLLMDVINDALDGCNLADLITSGNCFRENLKMMKEHHQMTRMKLKES